MAVLLVGCVGGPEGAEEEALAQEVIFGSSPQWQPITEVATDPAWRRASAYGRAVATVGQMGGLSGSGAMVSDSLLMTAHHCLPIQGNPVRLRFGLVGPSNAVQADAVLAARRRLRQLGVPSAVESAISNSPLVFQNDARRGVQEPGRDVVLVEVNPLVVNIPNDSGTLERVEIPMGDLWGRVPVREYNPASGRPAYALSVNTVCNNTTQQVLLSPGTTRSSTGCLPGYSACFGTNADALPGSSGGLFFDQTFQQAIGVFSSEPFEGDACRVSNSGKSNDIARLGPTVVAATASTPAGGWPDNLLPSASPPRIGGTGGIASVQSCPPGMLVRGLVGSTAPSNGYVGNLGIVCQPYTLPGRRGLHSAVVFAPGSVDTDFAVARGEPFHEYFASVRTNTSAPEQQQTLVLCPPDFLLRGIRTTSGSFVNRIVAIECAHHAAQSRALTIPLREDIGFIGTAPGGNAYTSRCGMSAYISGMTTRAGWHTDGFLVHCRAMPR